LLEIETIPGYRGFDSKPPFYLEINSPAAFNYSFPTPATLLEESMAFRGLKTLMAVHIAVLLLIAMGLVNLILVIFQQEKLIQQEVSKGRLFIQALESHIIEGPDASNSAAALERKPELDAMLSRSCFPCALIIDQRSRLISLGKVPCPLDVDIEQSIRAAMASGNETSTPFGTAWGVFWRVEQGIVLSVPLIRDTRVLGGISVVVPLEELYAGLRQSQKIVLIYILVNTTLLTGIGIYKFSRAYFKPVQRLARRADTYSEEDGLPFLVRKEDNEFGRLSQSLNRMLQRISEDKERLKSTIASLEKANIDLKQAQREIILAEKFASVGRLSSGIAHEIGNPLGIIGGYLELLRQKDIDDQERGEYVQRSIREVDRIHSIIRQLLDFSRPNEERAVLFSIHEAIADVIRILKPQPLMSGIDLKLSLSAQKDRILGDPDQVRQVFLNLVLNAADAITSTANQASGTIVISSQNIFPDGENAEDLTRIRLSITDNGIGIPEDNLEKIFDPFFTTKFPGKGTGLGLWVSFMIIERIGGSVSARSRPGEGATIEVLLPVHREKALSEKIMGSDEEGNGAQSGEQP